VSSPLIQIKEKLTQNIVKPDASPEEIRAVVNDEQGGQIFSQAVSLLFESYYRSSVIHNWQLMNSRYTESRAAYREVQERHEDIKRIEKTLGELAQLFNDVSNFPSNICSFSFLNI